MEKKSAKRKLLHRKYKRLAAAMAGAAILTGAALPGIPVVKAAAAERQVPAPYTKTEQLVPVDRDHDSDRARPTDRDRDRPSPRDGWHEHKYSWPGPDENQGWYQDGHIYYRSDRYHDDYDGYVNYISNPVSIVKNSAARYGFDRYGDSFTLISQSRYKATVEVIKQDTGQHFIVVLERDRGDDWSVTSVYRT